MILHIDMDAFFAAIEQRDRPELRNQPVIISRDHSRSVVATASYEARKFGIRSAMPVFQAKQRCKHLMIVPGNMKKYKAESRQIMAILSGFSPVVEQVSIDEAYMDITGCQRLFGSPEKIGYAVKAAILKSRSLTSSVGIAPVKFLAKIASDMNKPDGLTLIPQDRVMMFIRDLPIEKVPGVGRRAMAQMELLNIKTLGDVKHFSPDVLQKKFGVMGKRLAALSRGEDSNTVSTEHVRKSISSETTLSTDIKEFSAVKQVILDRSQTVGRQLRKKDLVCQTVFIKLKFSDFSQITRQTKLNAPASSSTQIFNAALSVYNTVKLKKKIRLVGVGVSDLKDKHTPVQLSLIPDENRQKTQWESVDTAVDSISEKFGSHIVQKANLKKEAHRILTEKKFDTSKTID